MLKKIRFSLLIISAFFIVSNAFAQNRFEGYYQFLDATEDQKSGFCALRYAAPTTKITITDLNPKTPMRLASCAGSDPSLNVTQTGSTATVNASNVIYKWCFTGEDKTYRISFNSPETPGTITYNWIATPETPGIYNLKDFGAVGDGKTDDTIAFKSAMAFIASRGGGKLQMPEGNFVITSPVTLPSGLIFQGISSVTTLAPTNNVIRDSPSRITLRGANRALFRIGECTENITIKDMELFAESGEKTYGIEALGAFTPSQNFVFDTLIIQNFDRGIYAHALPQSKLYWQFEAVKVVHCRFVYNRDAGIYNDISNSDWKISGCVFMNPKREPKQNANSIHIEHGGAFLIEDTFAGGFLTAIGGIFLDITDSAIVTVINCAVEQVSASLIYNDAKLQFAGDYSFPMTLINNIFGAPIIFKARRTFVSLGNLYLPNTFQADERLRVYSTGDRFCYDGYTAGCQSTTSSNNFDKATVIMMTGQPDEGSVKGRPTYFGTDVQFAAPVQMPSFLQNALPAGKPNGSMVYCSNCRRNSTPCQAGGTGAPAMVVGNQWSCL